MLARSRIIAALVIALILGAGSIRAADNKSIQGTLLSEEGKPLKGAEIHAQRVKAKPLVAIAMTDAHGRYWFAGLPVGAYSVTAYIDGVAMSRANVTTSSKGWTKVDFDLRLNAQGADGTDRMQRDVRMSSSKGSF